MLTRVMQAVVLVTALLVPSTALAQAAAGVITGAVKDSSGGAIPGSTVKVVNEASGVAVEAVSGDGGTYRVEALTPGRYRVEAALDGFETAVAQVVLQAGQTSTNDLTLNPARFSQSVVVTARRVEEVAQEVPIPVSVVRGDLVADAGAFNVNRLKEMLPTVQFYSTNPRNSSINIRGLGAPFGLTNDGIEPGVGLYIDGVFYARPASATLDFLDVEQVEVLRGPRARCSARTPPPARSTSPPASRRSRPAARSSSITATSATSRRRPLLPGRCSRTWPGASRSPVPSATASC
jgi:iron complex outermembrane receptor protein